MQPALDLECKRWRYRLCSHTLHCSRHPRRNLETSPLTPAPPQPAAVGLAGRCPPTGDTS